MACARTAPQILSDFCMMYPQARPRTKVIPRKIENEIGSVYCKIAWWNIAKIMEVSNNDVLCPNMESYFFRNIPLTISSSMNALLNANIHIQGIQVTISPIPAERPSPPSAKNGINAIGEMSNTSLIVFFRFPPRRKMGSKSLSTIQVPTSIVEMMGRTSANFATAIPSRVLVVRPGINWYHLPKNQARSNPTDANKNENDSRQYLFQFPSVR